MSIEYPNLAGIATVDLIEKIGGGSFSASYINWSRTMHLLRDNAPGWLPELVTNADGGLLHRAPIGAYLLIRFVHIDGKTTPAVPQAIMNNKNNSIALEAITSRDVTDTQVRGICKAAALTFGLAYELWAKMPLESGYAEQENPEQALELEVTDEQLAVLQDRMEANGTDKEAFFAILKISKLSDIKTVSKYNQAINAQDKKDAKKKQHLEEVT